MRLIDADKLLRDIDKFRLSDGKFQHWVEVQPTVDAVPVVHARWIIDVDEYIGSAYSVCSNCKGAWVFEVDEDMDKMEYHYCPNCGAKMDGDEE